MHAALLINDCFKIIKNANETSAVLQTGWKMFVYELVCAFMPMGVLAPEGDKEPGVAFVLLL